MTQVATKKLSMNDYAVFLRALRLRIFEHETESCACEFCDLHRRLEGKER